MEMVAAYRCNVLMNVETEKVQALACWELWDNTMWPHLLVLCFQRSTRIHVYTRVSFRIKT